MVEPPKALRIDTAKASRSRGKKWGGVPRPHPIRGVGHRKLLERGPGGDPADNAIFQF